MRTLVAAAVLLASATAGAKSHKDYQRTTAEVWPALVRFLRVDERIKITEKDAAAGYVLFELTDGKKAYRGSVEVTRTTDSAGREQTRVLLSLTDRPAYMEMGLLDRFEAKLHDELGPPKRPTENDANRSEK